MRGLREHRICRLCLSTGCHLVDILDENTEDEFVMKLAVEDLLRLVVVREALYPWLVCAICLEKLREFYFFKRRCVESQVVYDNRIRGNNWQIAVNCEDWDSMVHPSDNNPTEVLQSSTDYDIDFDLLQIPVKSEEGEGVENSMDVDSGHQPKTEVPGVDCEAPPGGIGSVGTCSQGCDLGYGTLSTQACLKRGQESAVTEVFKESTPASDVPLHVSASVAREEGQEKRNTSDSGSRREDEIISCMVLEEGESMEAVALHDNTRPSIRVMKRRRKNNAKSIECTEVTRNVDWIDVRGTGGGAGNHLPLSYENPHGRSFKCDKCGRRFRSMYSIGKHMKVHNVVSDFKCSTCNLDFDHEGEYKVHNCVQGKIDSRTLHDTDKRVPDSASSGQSKGRIQDVNPIVKKLLSCELCSKSFKNPSSLASHIRTHTGERPYSCTVCGRGFSEKSTLNIHMMLHNGKKPYSCSHCSKSFSRKDYFKSHMSVHTGIKPFSCNHCSKSFSKKQVLQRHMLVHTGIKNFSCHHCSKSFSEKQTLQRHMLVHTGFKAFSCSHCSKSFSLKKTLQRHMLVHTDLKAFSCSHCSKSFSRKDNLYTHMSVHTGRKAFSCNYCSKSFSSKHNLQSHMLVHTGLKTFSCTQCSDSFSSISILNQHMKVHS